ncbi:MAG: O-antigen ligase family protein [Acidobacteriia bacterium]|nr:O-antigen ligase family protein [Terriglobia bacterium]
MEKRDIAIAGPGFVWKPTQSKLRDATTGAFFWLSVFYVVYCARPEDLLLFAHVPLMAYLPYARISAILAILSLVLSRGKSKRGMKSLPIESKYLLAMILLLFLWAPLSPIWKGGALLRAADFGKLYFAWALTFLLVTSLVRLRRLILIQAGSVALIAIVSVLKGSSHPRLEGVMGGMYSNPNDLAFAIVLTLPLTLLLLLTSKSIVRKTAWGLAMLVMMYTLFLTASRAGFIDLVFSGVVMLWFFGVKGRRPQLIFLTAVLGVLLFIVGGKHLKERFLALKGSNLQTDLESSAYGSYEDRRYLMLRALKGISEYPLTGLGVRNFPPFSGDWHEVHVTYLQIAVEGGIPVLILYLLFFSSGFRNLKKLRRRRDLDPEARLYVGALYSSLVGFMIGACFAPEAYQYFPYFTVAYIAALRATAEERESETESSKPPSLNPRFTEAYANNWAVTVVR